MPANTATIVQAQTIRGVRKVTNSEWVEWSNILRPDILYALPDVPKTLGIAPGEKDQMAAVGKVTVVPGEGRVTSQKRIIKSLERTLAWLEELLRGTLPVLDANNANQALDRRPPILVQLMGGNKIRAREEFARSLVEKLDELDSKRVGGLKRLDDGVFGYVLELVDLPTRALAAPPPENLEAALEEEDEEFEPPKIEIEPPTPCEENAGKLTEEEIQTEKQVELPYITPTRVTGLLRGSLQLLPDTKPRIAHTAPSPHAILRLISECGIDLFDAEWATEAADLGVALVFEFPAPPGHHARSGTLPLGLNLFDDRYAEDFTPLGEGLGVHTGCASCQPKFSDDHILHSNVDASQWENSPPAAAQGYTKAYIHHLLQTHEMSSHILLHFHNLAVVSDFFSNIRTMLLNEPREKFEKEVKRFYSVYDPNGTRRLLDEAKLFWKKVEDARGKGRLKREKEAALHAEANAALENWAVSVEGANGAGGSASLPPPQ